MYIKLVPSFHSNTKISKKDLSVGKERKQNMRRRRRTRRIKMK